MTDIDELLTKGAQAIRNNPDRYASLQPKAAIRRSPFVRAIWGAAFVAAGILFFMVFQSVLLPASRRTETVTVAELQKLATETLQFAERVAERKSEAKHNRAARHGRIFQNLESDRTSMRRLIRSMSRFGRGNEGIKVFGTSELSS